jgi:ATP diphosphatase
MDLNEAAKAFRQLVSVIKALRTPEMGCPWDLEQDHQSLRPYLIEETYEVLDAIDRADDPALRDELGDFLLQVVLHAQIADDRGAFSITEVLEAITKKMVRRHPHVFGSVRVSSLAEVKRIWERIKAGENEARGVSSTARPGRRLPGGLPALLRAQRLGENAVRDSGDGTLFGAVLGTVRQQIAELEAVARARGDSTAPAEAGPPLASEQRARLEHALGHLLFNVCQLARLLGLNAEDSLRTYNRVFDEGSPKP